MTYLTPSRFLEDVRTYSARRWRFGFYWCRRKQTNQEPIITGSTSIKDFNVAVYFDSERNTLTLRTEVRFFSKRDVYGRPCTCDQGCRIRPHARSRFPSAARGAPHCRRKIILDTTPSIGLKDNPQFWESAALAGTQFGLTACHASNLLVALHLLIRMYFCARLSLGYLPYVLLLVFLTQTKKKVRSAVNKWL